MNIMKDPRNLPIKYIPLSHVNFFDVPLLWTALNRVFPYMIQINLNLSTPIPVVTMSCVVSFGYG